MPNSAWTISGNTVTVSVTASSIDNSSASVDYLSNADKISLLAQYASELSTKSSLDTTAASLSCSTTAYDAAVAAINTTLVNAGAPANWATIWPDNTSFGPVVGIETLLAQDWATVATTRTALQSAISAANAAVAETAAVSSAATDALNKTNAAVLCSQPHQVTWAYASKPTLPSSSYPAGYYAITSDSRTVQVSTDGSTWDDVLVATTGLFGQVIASQITVIDTTNLCKNPTWADGLSSCWTYDIGGRGAVLPGYGKTGGTALEVEPYTVTAYEIRNANLLLRPLIIATRRHNRRLPF